MNENLLETFQIKLGLNRPLLIDGALGSLLEKIYPSENDPDIWMTQAITNHPDEILKIHQDYQYSGADIITTMTFRTNPLSLGIYNSKNKGKSLPSSSEYVKYACKLVQELREKENILIAGSNPPAEECYSKRTIKDYEILKDNHYNHINDLMKNGSDFVLNETIGNFDEIDLVCKLCFQSNFPFVISIYFDNSLNLLCGKSAFEAVSYIDNNFSPLAISANCMDAKTFSLFAENSLLLNTKNRFGYYLNCGDIGPEEYSHLTHSFNYLNPIFVGHCCMSDPSYTRELKLHFETNAIKD